MHVAHGNPAKMWLEATEHRRRGSHRCGQPGGRTEGDGALLNRRTRRAGSSRRQQYKLSGNFGVAALVVVAVPASVSRRWRTPSTPSTPDGVRFDERRDRRFRRRTTAAHRVEREEPAPRSSRDIKLCVPRRPGLRQPARDQPGVGALRAWAAELIHWVTTAGHWRKSAA